MAETPCPSEDTLIELLEGRLAAVTLAELHRHIDACPECYALLGALTEGRGGASVLRDAPMAAEGQLISAPSGEPGAPPAARERYTLMSLHAEGGVGQVWLARDETLCRTVALKELRPKWNDVPQAGARFLAEARITGQLEHPGIVPIYELARHADSGRPYYTMRFIRGRTLADATQEYHRLRTTGRAGPLALRELLGAFVAVCNAVGYAHSRGVVHRDLKGSNVALGDYGEVLVLASSVLLTSVVQGADRRPSWRPMS